LHFPLETFPFTISGTYSFQASDLNLLVKARIDGLAVTNSGHPPHQSQNLPKKCGPRHCPQRRP
jgi:hypothetical protein